VFAIFAVDQRQQNKFAFIPGAIVPRL